MLLEKVSGILKFVSKNISHLYSVYIVTLFVRYSSPTIRIENLDNDNYSGREHKSQNRTCSQSISQHLQYLGRPGPTIKPKSFTTLTISNNLLINKSFTRHWSSGWSNWSEVSVDFYVW